MKNLKEKIVKLTADGEKWQRESWLYLQKKIALPETDMDEELLLDLMRGDGIKNFAGIPF